MSFNKSRSCRLFAGAVAALAALLPSVSRGDVALSGQLPSGYWTDLLHLGSNFNTDDLVQGGDDWLAGWGGQANQHPYPGQKYTDLRTSGSTATPGSLVWTPSSFDGGIWQPSNRDSYTKFWHVYVIVPGTSPREVYFYTRQDDDVRVWNNGILAFESIGWDNNAEKGPFPAVLVPGQNSITIRLDEGTGGDYMAIRVTDRNNNPYSDLTYSLVPSPEFCDPLAGISGFTSTNAAKVAFLPSLPTATEYQLSLSNDPAELDTNGWLAYTEGLQPDSIIDFPKPATSLASIAIYAWFRTNGDDSTIESVSNSILYNVTPPVAVTKDIVVPINPAAGREILPIEIDAGSHDDFVGVRSMAVSPGKITGSGPVTLTVYNSLGVAGTATAQITAVPAEGPLPHGNWTTMLHLGTIFNQDDLSNSGGIDADHLESYGGQANQKPYHGLTYDGLPTALHGTAPLTWTASYDSDGHWEPSGRDNYIKYWHVYLNVPGPTNRTARFNFLHDDNVRAWNNGSLFYSRNYDGAWHSVDTPLVPGLNSITFKLEEGGGGDYFEVNMTDTAGNFMDDVTFQLDPTEFKIENPITGSVDFLGTNALRVAKMPRDPGATAYQLTLSGDEASIDSDNWLEYFPGMTPSDLFSFAEPAADGPITIHAWMRSSIGTNHYEGPSITYTHDVPIVKVKPADLDIDPVNGTTVLPSDIDDGTSDPVSGIYSLSVVPPVIYEPTDVTLVAMNNAGLVSTATTSVAPSFWAALDVVGDDTAYSTLEASFQAVAYGSPAATATVFCSWNFGDGSAAVEGQDLFSTTHLYDRPGAFDVSLTMTSALGDVSVTNIVKAIKILGDRFVASADAGAGVYPYTDETLASSDIAAVVAAAQQASAAGAEGVVVEVGPGSYDLTTQIDLVEPITLLGVAGPADTHLRQTVDQLCVVTVSTNATVAGLTLHGKFISNDNRVGGGIRMTSGVATNIVVTDCTGGGHAIGPLYGSAYLDGDAYMVDSSVVNNRNWYNGGALWIKGSAIADRCEIAYNYGSAQHHSGDGGAGVRMESGTVRNCFIHHNESIYHAGGGVRIDNGLLENCTIVANQVGASDNVSGMGAGGVRHNGGTVRNCIIYGNHDYAGTPSDYAGTGGATYSCAPELVSGTGNIALDPLFADVASGDYRPQASSPCVDSGTAIDPSVALDFSLGARVVDGNGDGTPAIDMGCFEYVRDTSIFDCSFVVEGDSAALGSLDASFTATLYGSFAATSSVTCAWDFGDGSELVTGHNLFEVGHKYDSLGLFTVTLSVVNSLGESVSFARPDCICVLSSQVYAATNGAAIFPYATPETAATDLGEAFKVVPRAFDCGATSAVVSIGPGEFTISSEFALDKPITVIGSGRDATHVRQVSDDQRVFVISDPAAIVSSLTVHGKYTPNNRWGGGIHLTGGMATNVVVTGCTGGGHAIGGLCGSVYLGGSNATLVDSLVISNRYDYNGGGVWLESDSALVDRCEIAWNRGSMQHHSGDGGGGVRIWVGTVRNCLIHHNTSIFHPGGGVRNYFGTLENCTIVDNSVEQNGIGNGGGVFQQGGTVRNCIIAGNRCDDTNQGGVNAGPEDYHMHDSQYVANTCAPEVPEENGNIRLAPVFKDAANCDYHIGFSSPTVGAGSFVEWMDGAVDLDGEIRVLGRAVDMGCYETRLPGTLIFIR